MPGSFHFQMENQIVVNDYRQMDKILKEERQYLLNLCKKVKKSGCNVLLIQKSILRDAVNDLSLHFLSKLKIMVIKDIEREEIEFISKVSFFVFHVPWFSFISLIPTTCYKVSWMQARCRCRIFH
jgi:hypothetical protein